MKRLLVAALLGATLVAGCSPAKSAQSQPTAAAPAPRQMINITAEELQKRLQAGEKPLIIDVREPDEFAAGHIQGARLAPLGRVEKEIADVPTSQEIILVCHSGNRSAQAYQVLAGVGYKHLKNMEGGMTAWEKLGYSTAK
jgi:rhodanese-related sulfurtransferase